jgi:hypothetical protein
MKILRSIPLFDQFFSVQFLKNLCLIIEEKKIKPQEIIYQTGDIPDKLFFLFHG